MEHVGCATYLVATGRTNLAEGLVPPAERVTRASGRDLVRTAPLVLDHGRLPVSVSAAAAERGLGQVALLILLAIAFAALLVARLSSGSGDPGGILGGGTTPDPGVVALEPSAATTPAPSVDGAPGPTPLPTAAETAVPSAPPAATAAPGATEQQTTYKVRSGDTLSGIASTFGTTVDVLTKLNDIKDASSLRIGQILRLP